MQEICSQKLDYYRYFIKKKKKNTLFYIYLSLNIIRLKFLIVSGFSLNYFKRNFLCHCQNYSPSKKNRATSI